MKLRQWIGLGVVLLLAATGLAAQQADSIASTNNPPLTSQTVPRLILFSGTLKDLAGKPLTGPVELNFAIYKEQGDAAPLWQESQTLNLDEQGHYTALLGAMQPEGLPVDLFTSGEARWLGVSAGNPSGSLGQWLPEQPRVLLVSVPYALKANDAEMLGGKPASAYALAPPAGSPTSAGTATAGTTAPGGAAASELATPSKPKSGPKPNVTGVGTQYYIPLWTDSAGTLGNSVIYQKSGLLGIGTTTPAAKLDVAGSVGHFLVDTSGAQFRFTRGGANYFLASTAGGYFDFVANGLTPSDANASLKLAANGVVNFMAGNVGIGTLTPAQKLDVAGNIKSSGTLAGTQLVSTVATGTAPLSVASTTLVPNLNADLLDGLHASAFATLGANAFTGGETISSGDLSLPQTTDASSGVINLGGSRFLHACCSATQYNTFVGGSAGNFTTTGTANTATGIQALYANTTGGANTASGSWALYSNTAGSNNTASGNRALFSNTTGQYNTASGDQALNLNTEGFANTASGAGALGSNTTGDFNTASGSWALLGNTTGNVNTASGTGALSANTTGSDNTASGTGALSYNTTGQYNTAVGYQAGQTATNANANVTGTNDTFIGSNNGPGTSTELNNATAIGANAVVSESNALVLGSINGVNGATAGVNVGIGTAAPAHVLDVVGDINATSNITTGGVFTGNGSGLTNLPAGTASGLSCTGCVGNTQLGVNYAGSTTQGGAASNALLLNGLASSAFQPAGSYAVTTGPNSFTGTETVIGGNVGIGTTAPVSPLNVAGTTGLTWTGGGTNLGLATFGTPGTGGSLYVNTASGSSTYQSGLGIDGTYGTPALQSVINIRALGVHSGGGYGSQLAFWTTNGTALNQQMTIDKAGNVGIGTTAPAHVLDVVGDINASTNINAGGNLSVTGTITGNGSGLANVAAATAATATNALALGGLAPSAYAPATGSAVYLAKSGATMVGTLNLPANGLVAGTNQLVLSGGNVGVGTASPGQMLEVAGTVKATAFSGDGSALTNINANQVAPPLNLEQVALLKWYPASQAGTAFSVGSNPLGVAFDGANIWVANATSNNVTKLRAVDGANLGTFAVGTTPSGVAFDGANIWVPNVTDNNVTKLRASDGATLGTFAVGGVGPTDVAFDGANIWVTNYHSNNITKLRASDGGNLGTFAVGTYPIGVAFDGANIWVANRNSNNVTKLRAADGGNLGTFGVGANPGFAAFDGANIWVTNSTSNTVTKLRASDGANLGTFDVGSYPYVVAFDGANIWVANNHSNDVTKLRASDGLVLGTFAVGGSPEGVAFDGANIWVANYGSNTVSKL